LIFSAQKAARKTGYIIEGQKYNFEKLCARFKQHIDASSKTAEKVKAKREGKKKMGIPRYLEVSEIEKEILQRKTIRDQVKFDHVNGESTCTVLTKGASNVHIATGYKVGDGVKFVFDKNAHPHAHPEATQQIVEHMVEAALANNTPLKISGCSDIRDAILLITLALEGMGAKQNQIKLDDKTRDAILKGDSSALSPGEQQHLAKAKEFVQNYQQQPSPADPKTPAPRL
jgi:hypothetical protein